jgi:hypothetical protein
MSLSELDGSGKRVLMFGGKGGVGKTTCSATAVLHRAARPKLADGVDSEKVRCAFYWDVSTGIPTRGRLQELGTGCVVDVLALA